MHVCLYLLSLLWSMVEVYTQPTAPYVSFRGVNLLNHSYVDLSLVGDPETSTSSGDAVQCHTDIQACCSSAEGGTTSGNWYFPDGSSLPFASDLTADIHRQRAAQRVELRRRDDALSPSGIYRCKIMVDGDDNIQEEETVHVGIYGSGGAITISDGMTFDMISDDEFTLTCISTGGPATTVTWTRDSVTVTEGTKTVFNTATADTIAEYTHALTASTPGDYTCTVSNNKPSSDSADFSVQVTEPPTNVRTVQQSPTSIRVSWTPPSDATGYSIDYTSNGGSSYNVTVSGGTTNERLLTGLENGAIYIISIMATAEASLPSVSVEAEMRVPLVPAQPTINMDPSITATSISLSWSVADSVVTSSVVSWERDTSGECPDEDEDSSITGSSTGYTINGLEEDSKYFITVTVSNAAGSSKVSDTITTMTLEAAPTSAPTSVSISAVTTSSITLQWGLVNCINQNGDITGYSVRYTGGGSTQTMAVPGDSSGGTYVIYNLESSTTYSIQVAAVTGGSHIGRYSSIVTEDTSVGLILSVMSFSPTMLTVSWILDMAVTATSYTISYSNTVTDCFTDSGASTDIDGDETMYTLTGLEEGTEYTVTVTTLLTSGETVVDMQTSTTIATAPSAAPTSVSVSVVNSTAITVQWGMVPCIHRNGDITGYSVQYTGDKSTQTMYVTGGEVTMTTISDLRSSATYVIEMAVVNSDGTGVYSAPQIIVPGQPSVSITSITATSISLSWSVPSDSVVTSYEVMWRETDSGATEMTSGSLTDTSYTIEQLDSTTIYTVTVTASNTVGSLPVIISTGPATNNGPIESTAAITSGVVVAVVILSICVTVVIVLRNRSRGKYTTGQQKRGAVDTALELPKLSKEATYIDPDVIRSSSNKAYHTPPTADEYEEV